MQRPIIMDVEDQWFNFTNSINSNETRKIYTYCLEQFLLFNKTDLNKFLNLPPNEMTQIIIKYLVGKKVSKSNKDVIFFSIKHACVVNDCYNLNWKKIKKFIKSEKTGNEILGKDRPYTHQELQQILNFSEQRLKTAFLILASSGIRIGALDSLKVGDLERIDDLYKVTVYAGEREEYVTFITPEASKEVDNYLAYRQRRGHEKITRDSLLIVKKFKQGSKAKPLKGTGLRGLLQRTIEASGLRSVDPSNPYKRKPVALLHGVRKFFTKQLVDSNVDKGMIELLLGHDIGLTGRYWKPADKEKLNEYYKAVGLLTISDEERLKFKLEERIQIERTQYESLKSDFEKFKQEVKAMNRKRK